MKIPLNLLGFTLSIFVLSSGLAKSQEEGGGWMDLQRLSQPLRMLGENSILQAPFRDWDSDGLQDFLMVGGNQQGPGQSLLEIRVVSGATGSAIFQVDIPPGWALATQSPPFGNCTLERIGDVNQDGFPDYGLSLYATYLSGVQSGMMVLSGFDLALLASLPHANPSTPGPVRILNAGDLDGDGIPDFRIIEANQGFVRLFSGANFSQLRSFTIPSLANGAPLGDLNGDGVSDFVLQATPGSSFFAQFYSGIDDQLLSTLPLDTPRNNPIAIADLGDINGDLHDDFGLVQLNPSLLEIRNGADSSLLRAYSLAPFSTGGTFGNELVAIGDRNSDGITELAIGFGRPDLGEAIFWQLDPRTGMFEPALFDIYPTREANWHLKTTLMNVGDLSGDGRDDLLVGLYAETRTYVWRDFMQLNQSSISASTGGDIQGSLCFPITTAGLEYHVLLSLSGTGPSTYGIPIPLTADALFLRTLRGHYPSQGSFPIGIVDSNGKGGFSFSFSPGELVGASGRTIYIATVVLEPGHLPQYSSTASVVAIVP